MGGLRAPGLRARWEGVSGATAAAGGGVSSSTRRALTVRGRAASYLGHIFGWRAPVLERRKIVLAPREAHPRLWSELRRRQRNLLTGAPANFPFTTGKAQAPH
jgi:hypothetical protein